MEVNGSQMLGLGVAGLLVYALAALTVAARRLGRFQRRAWAEGRRPGDEPDVENGSTTTEIAFIALGLGRQLALVFLVVQIVLRTTGAEAAIRPALAFGASIPAYLLLDKLLPYWTVGWFGPERVLALGRPLVWIDRVLLGPVATYLARASARSRGPDSELAGERPDLGAFLDLAEEEGMMSESEEAILRGFADFEDTVAREVMTPRVDVVSIEEQATIGDLRSLIARHKLSRIPVTRDDLDHVAGVVHLKDLVSALDEGDDSLSIREIMRPAWFVPETKKVSELLQEFQQRQAQLSIVVDEYGGTAGLVTLEDVLEEIVGEIQDESEEQENLVVPEGDGVLASGKAEIEDVEEALEFEVPDGDFHTVGGMVFTHLGHVPKAGEAFDFGGLHIEVLAADDRRIHRVRITPL